MRNNTGSYFGALLPTQVWYAQDIWTTGVGGHATDAISYTPALVQGVDANNRIGDKVRIHRIKFMLYITPQAGGTDLQGIACRVVVVHDNRCNGATISPTDIFAEVTPSTSASLPMNSLYNYNNIPEPGTRDASKRYTIVKDIVHEMVVTSSSSGGDLTAGPILLTTFETRPNVIVKFDSAGSGLSHVQNHTWFAMVAATGSACCAVSLSACVWYTDV
nr:MAG: capsid protein [Cressdnaviricota sp.]